MTASLRVEELDSSLSFAFSYTFVTVGDSSLSSELTSRWMGGLSLHALTASRLVSGISYGLQFMICSVFSSNRISKYFGIGSELSLDVSG